MMLEHFGNPCELPKEADEVIDWQSLERYSALVKKNHCKDCKRKTSDEQTCRFQYPYMGANYRVTINCKTCKKY